MSCTLNWCPVDCQAFKLLPIMPTVIYTDKRSKDGKLNRDIDDRLYYR